MKISINGVQEIKKKVEMELMKYPNVVSVGIGCDILPGLKARGFLFR